MDCLEQIKNVIELLSKEGINRRTVEKELSYSEGYIDQTISKGGNKRLLAALRMFYSYKMLEKASKHGKAPETVLAEFWEKQDAVEPQEELLKRIDANLIETRHTVELSQVIVKAVLNQTARLESLATKSSLKSVLSRLNEVSEEIFLKMHPELNQTNESE